MTMETGLHCRNSSNPYHVCGGDFCSKDNVVQPKRLSTKSFNKQDIVQVKRLSTKSFNESDCRNSSNPYHDCSSEFCSKDIVEAKKLGTIYGQLATKYGQDCRNSSNPYHECGSEYCSEAIAEAKILATKYGQDCRNSSNPYHDCSSEFCSKGIAEAKKLATKTEPAGLKAKTRSSRQPSIPTFIQTDLPYDDKSQPDDHPSEEDSTVLEDQPEVDPTKFTRKQKKLYELMLEMNEAAKTNQSSIVAETEGSQESRRVSVQKWMDEGLLHDIIEGQRIAKADRELILRRQEYQDAMLQWMVESQRIMATKAGITLPPVPQRDQTTPQQDPFAQQDPSLLALALTDIEV